MNRIRAVKRFIKVTRQISVAIFLPEYSGPPPVVVPNKEPKGILCIPFDFQPKFLESVESMEDSGSTGLWVSGPLGSLGSFRVLRASGPRRLGIFGLS